MRREKEALIIGLMLVSILSVFLFGDPRITGYTIKDETTALIENAKIDFKSMNSEHKEVLNILGIELDQEILEEFEGRITAAEDSEAETIKEELDEFLEPLPNKILRISGFKDLQVIEPSDIKNPYAFESEEEAYLYQRNANIIFEVARYEIEYYSDSKSTYTLIKKSIKSNIGEAFVYEVMPVNIDDIRLGNKAYEKEGKSSVRYEFASLNDVKLAYILNREITTDDAYNFKTIIVPKTIEKSNVTEASNYECGDGICTIPYEDDVLCPSDCIGRSRRIPWLYIAIILIILAMGIFYLNLYRGKSDFRRLTKGKSPFYNNVDLENVKGFIKDSMNKNLKIGEISKALLAKGWSKKQVAYAYEEARWDMRKVLLEIAPKINVSNVADAENYARKCLNVGLDELKIKAALLSKGWKPEQIENAFKKAKSKR